ncbi:MAG: peptide deformylase [Candidatus Gracilibacteria bacterium]|nr:peptide deformylase [Candidatus Gracilibacteria bacterium]
MKIETGEKNTILRSISEKIKKDEIKKYVAVGKDMIKYIKNPDNGGVGLARPQIGINKRLIVVSLLRNREDENFQTIMMINPEILEFGNETNLENEGCLSVPGKKGQVERCTIIKLSFLDEKGNEKIIILKGVGARIVQHEIDHLNGILFTDKIA